MKGQKASRVEALEKHLQMQKHILEQLFNELTHIKNLAITTLETFKEMEGYDAAVKQFKDKMEKLEKESVEDSPETGPTLIKDDD